MTDDQLAAARAILAQITLQVDHIRAELAGLSRRLDDEAARNPPDGPSDGWMYRGTSVNGAGIKCIDGSEVAR